MKVIVVGPYSPDSLEYNLVDSLRRMGHDAAPLYLPDVSRLYRFRKLLTPLEYARKARPGFDRSLAVKLGDRVLAAAPDFVLVTPRTLHPAFVDRLKDARPGLPVVHLNPDNITTLDRGQIFLSRFDAYFVKDRFMERFMRDKIGLNAHYLPECYNPGYHVKPNVPKADAEARLDIDVMVMGGVYAYRSIFMERLLEAGFRLAIFGRTFEFVSGRWSGCFRNEYLRGPRKAEVVYGSRVVLNNMYYAEIEAVNCKFFEYLGCGGFQVCDHTPVVHELAEPDREVVTFRSADEAIEKIRHYLDRPDERRAIAAAGYARASREHRYEDRLEAIFSHFPGLPA